MIDYKNGKIYQIVCNETGEIYIGSSAVSLEDRLKYHKCKSSKCCSKQIINRGKYYIELLETYPCNSKYELERKEGEYQKLITCINIRIAGRTETEWRQDNKEKRAKYDCEYRQNNLEHKKNMDKQRHIKNALHVSEKNKVKTTCECGSTFRISHITRHKRTKKHLKHIDLMNKLNLS